jgi:methyl-accepting chemotaxis protein
MKLIAALSVKARLGALVLMALAGTLLVAGIGLYGLQLATRSALVVAERHLPAEGLIGELRAGIGNLRRFEKDAFLSTGSPKGLDTYLPRWQAALQHQRQTLKDIEPLLDDEALAQLGGVRDSLERYARGFDTVAARLMRGEFADPISANDAMEPLKADIRQLDERMVAMKKHVDAQAAQERDAMVALQRHEAIAQLIVVLLVAAATTGLAVAVVRSVTGPLQQANEALARLADGDLSQTLQADGRDELSQMIQRLAQTQSALRELVQAIQGNAQNVASASTQIAQGTADLSVRTERQAASLQETAASMEQLTATVKTGAETARQANGMARAASDSARQGGAVVAQVVQTMAGIQQASRRIADITGVIDSIAFQTNILALNAAVEAARAGEQGRGFAVVAAEVRTLAHRSADAAREIKALIGDSVERVEAGHQLVRQAGGTLDQAVQQAQRVTDLVGEISSAASEQQQGLTQIGVAVSQLDQATQQNAALVEESAAASDSLRQQAERLTAATAVFRLHGDNDFPLRAS